jgi:hypothetical protein
VRYLSFEVPDKLRRVIRINDYKDYMYMGRVNQEVADIDLIEIT